VSTFTIKKANDNIPNCMTMKQGFVKMIYSGNESNQCRFDVSINQSELCSCEQVRNGFWQRAEHSNRPRQNSSGRTISIQVPTWIQKDYKMWQAWLEIALTKIGQPFHQILTRHFQYRPLIHGNTARFISSPYPISYNKIKNCINFAKILSCAIAQASCGCCSNSDTMQ
jgi:hypothetical protein